MARVAPSNDEIADLLEEKAALLQAQHANAFRVHAWESAARAIRNEPQALAELADREGRAALVALPHIGRSIAAAIDEIAHTGRFVALERLRGEVSPEDLFCTLPGIGETLATRLHHELQIDTLEELELAAHDGRLEALPGFGARRALAIRDMLAARLARSSRRRARRARWLERPDFERPEQPHRETAPPASLLLRVDRDYRQRAARGVLRRIAPRRFNPTGDRWLPIMHDTHGQWHFTALYSNTARAHQLHKTGDWVVIYYDDDGDESQCTVVTEHHGPLTGRRVVRGREHECAEVYGVALGGAVA